MPFCFISTFSLLLFFINFCLANLYLSPGEAFAKRQSLILVQGYVYQQKLVTRLSVTSFAITKGPRMASEATGHQVNEDYLQRFLGSGRFKFLFLRYSRMIMREEKVWRTPSPIR